MMNNYNPSYLPKSIASTVQFPSIKTPSVFYYETESQKSVIDIFNNDETQSEGNAH